MSSCLGVVPRSFCCTAEVDRFCLQILLLPVRVNQENITECLESVARSFGSEQGAVLPCLSVTHGTAGEAQPQLPQPCAALGIQHLHPQQQISPFQSAWNSQLCQASFYLCASLPLPLSYSIVHSWFFLCFLTNSQEHNASSLQSHSG